MKLSFDERKVLLQLSVNPFVSSIAQKSKRVQTTLKKLHDNGLIVLEQDWHSAELTEAGLSAITT